ncbi:MAG: hypothetical protein BWY45_03215 [Euryarchaeota archaeon ADurb.Bin294]|nr:MAG: hypothetical protein BWY45_03215 [Euryarchaeota archaeon ADurb.Bin294]
MVKKNVGGRPRKDSDETMKKVLDGIKAGLSYQGACGLARVSFNTFNRWRQEGEKASSGKFWEFLKELSYAEAVAEAEQLKKIKNDPDTKYACWILERRHPDRWGRKDQLKQEITGDSGGPIKFVTFAEHRRNDETDD